MGKEEQVEERDVLDSIFPEEITYASDSDFRVQIKLDIIEEGEPGHEDNRKYFNVYMIGHWLTRSATIILHVIYPEAYPDEPPELDILKPINAPRYPHLEVSEDKPLLLESLNSTIQESLGMAMIYTLISTLKESAEELINSRLAAIQAERDRITAIAEAEENKKFEGTKVTPEAFRKWYAAFQKEVQDAELEREKLEKEEEQKKRKGPKEEKKFTGKELWEKGLAGNSVDEGDDDDEDVLGDMSTLKVG